MVHNVIIRYFLKNSTFHCHLHEISSMVLSERAFYFWRILKSKKIFRMPTCIVDKVTKYLYAKNMVL